MTSSVEPSVAVTSALFPDGMAPKGTDMTATPRITAPAHAPWGLTSRIVGLAVAVLLLGGLVMSFIAFEIFERRLTPEVHAKAETVGRTVSGQLTRVLDYGVPFSDIIGMEEFLASMVDNNEEFSYMVVADADGNILYSFGPDADAAVARISFLRHPADGTEVVATRSLGEFLDTAIPILTNDGIEGRLHVGVPRIFLARTLLEGIDDVLLFLVTAIITLYFMVAVVVRMRVTSPIGAMRKGMMIGEFQDFRHRLQTAATDDVYHATSKFNMVTRRLGERFQRLVEEFDESKAGQIDEGIAGRLDGVMGRFLRSCKAEAPDERIVLSDDVTLRGVVPLFLLVVAEAMVLPKVAAMSQYGYEIGILALGLGLMMLMVTGAKGRSLARYIYFPSVFLGALGTAGTVFLTDWAPVVVWQGVAGIGIGGVAATILGGMYLESTSDHTVNLGPPLLAAALSGIALDAVMAAGLGGHVLSWLVVGFGVGAVLSAWSLPWASPVSVVGMELDGDDGHEPAAQALLRRRAVAKSMLVVVPGVAGLTGMIFHLLPVLSESLKVGPDPVRGMLVYLLLVWCGTAFVVSRHGRMIPLRLVGLLGGLCAAFGAAYFGMAGGDVETLPKIATFVIGSGASDAQKVAWLGLLAMALGHALSLAPIGMVVAAATHSPWRPFRTKAWLSVIGMVCIGAALGPLVASALLASYGLAISALVLAGAMLFATLMVFVVPRHSRLEPAQPLPPANSDPEISQMRDEG